MDIMITTTFLFPQNLLLLSIIKSKKRLEKQMQKFQKLFQKRLTNVITVIFSSSQNIDTG